MVTAVSIETPVVSPANILVDARDNALHDAGFGGETFGESVLDTEGDEMDDDGPASATLRGRFQVLPQGADANAVAVEQEERSGKVLVAQDFPSFPALQEESVSGLVSFVVPGGAASATGSRAHNPHQPHYHHHHPHQHPRHRQTGPVSEDAGEQESRIEANLSSSSSAQSLFVDSLSSGESLSRLESEGDFGDANVDVGVDADAGTDADADAPYMEDEEHSAKSSGGGTIYGKVVKSIQHSIRRIFHCGKTPPKSEDGVGSVGFVASADCFATADHQPMPIRLSTPPASANTNTNTTTAIPAANDDEHEKNNPEVPLSAIQPAGSPITSVDPGDLPLFEINKKLLAEFSAPVSTAILSDPRDEDRHKKCLVLDLDETLVHSTFQPIPNADLVVPVHLGQGVFQPIYVCKRPGVDEFLRHVATHFEVIIFTASLSNYADPVIDFLDPEGTIRFRLYREACLQFQGMYIKDLSRLGRDLDKVVIVDNSPISYSMHRKNALACRSWFADPKDRELEERLLPVLLKLVDAPGVSQWRRDNLEAIKTPYYK